MRRIWVAAAASILTAAFVLFRLTRHAHAPPPSDATPTIAHATLVIRDDAPRQPESTAVPGLDLARIQSDADGFFAPVDGGTARLTLDPDLQRLAVSLLAAHHLPEAAVVLMDVATGHLLVYASHIERGDARDLCAEAKAPSASVFKIVTAAALLEDAHLEPDTRQCYSGGEQRISSVDLVGDPHRDRWCTTLAGAMGRSINTVFARLANDYLTPPQLEAMARRFGYGESPAFDVPVQPSGLRVPVEPLEFARTAAGFWNTTLSPIEAAELSAIVARGGERIRPTIVDKVVSGSGALVWSPPDTSTGRRAVTRDTADRLSIMMEHTLSEGTCWKAFHDARGGAFLPSVSVAGKTGTLTDAETRRFYTWFTGFAPVRGEGNVPKVAVAVLVVNGPTWQLKANVVAREVLRAYFAAHDVPGVTRPGLVATARRRRTH
ncbi:MAG: penicillin-binding transpeptidase domain-containing protein [Polyangiaceae bacterium]|jgi:cell division protein FtsI/penicillin-binding protein 2